MIVSNFQLVTRLVAFVALFTLGSVAYGGGADTDSDGIPDSFDNCILIFNPLQEDTDLDGFGNYCDGDFNQDGIVNLLDLGMMRIAFFNFVGDANYDPDIDMNSDGVVNFLDLQLIKVGFFLFPGPAANQAPTAVALDNTSVDENQLVGTAVGTFTTTDINFFDTHTYTLVAGAGNTDNAQFAIAGDQLETAAVLNHEAADNCLTSTDTCSIRVQTDDGNGGQFQQSFIININDVNDAPTDVALDNSSVDENQPSGTAVGILTTTDEDSTDTHTYTLVAGAGATDNAQFTIVGSQLQTAAVFDFETTANCLTSATTCSILVQTDDGNGGQFQESFIININDVNDAPTDIALDNTNVDENQPNATPVGNFSTTDEDTADSHTYTLVGGVGDADNAKFQIGGGNQLQTAAVFDFEGAGNCATTTTRGVGTSCSIRVQTDDGNGGVDQEVFTITINAVNDAPTAIALDSTDVLEAEPVGTAVGTFSTTDQDSAAFSYTLATGTGDSGNASFVIVGDQLQTAAVFDESVQNSYSIRVQTDDGAGGMFEEVFTITVTPLNATPTDIALSNTSVDENESAGTAVGTFTTTDADAGDTHTYTLVAGIGDTDNSRFTIVGDQLQTDVVFNFEGAGGCPVVVARGSGGTCLVRVQTDDGNGGIYQEFFGININNVNDAPTDIALSNTSVDENEPIGTAVGNLSTTDEDIDPHTYTLVAGVGATDNAQFMIVGAQLQTAAVLDFETAANCMTSATTCSVRVQTDDGSGGVFQKSFIININDVVETNAPPVANDDTYTTGIGNTRFQLVAAPTGASFPATVQFVGTVIANDTDADAGDTLSTTASASIATTQGGTASIDTAGRFIYTPAVTFPSATVDSFTYEVCDDGTPMECVNGTVNITGSNIVWYVDDSSLNNPGAGTSANPFRALSSAAGPSLAGETIFIHSGLQTSGITLKNNQKLIGEGVALVVNSVTLVNPGVRPNVSQVAGAAVTLGMSNTIRGLDIGGNTGIFGSGFATLTADNVAISTSGSAGLDLSNGAGSVIFDSVSSSGSVSTGIRLNSVSGSFTLGGGAISGSSGNAFDVSSSSATISYDGTINTATPRPVSITGQSAGSVSFGGAITTTGQRIELTGNTSGTFTFAGGLSLTTGSDNGIHATGGGTLNICNDTNCSAPGGTPVTNTIQNGSATALHVSMNIGSNGLTFRSISSNGGPAGIVLNNTGTAGGLTVTGDGSTSQGGNDTGGIIQNKSGDGISLTNTQDVTLQNMTIGDTTATAADAADATSNIGGDGIETTGVTNLTLQSVTIARTGGHGINADNGLTNLVIDDSLILNAGNGDEEHGLNLDELRGDNFVRDSLFDAFNETAIEVENASGTVDLTISNTTFQDNQATVGNVGEEAILLRAGGDAQMVVLITGTAGDPQTSGTTSIFNQITTQAVQAISEGSTSDIQLTIENSRMLEFGSGALPLGDGIIIFNPDNAGSGNITVKNNFITDNTLGPFAIILKNDSSGSLDGTIQSNVVTEMQMLNVNHDDVGSGGAANGTTRVLVQGNTVTPGSDNYSIDVIATESGPVAPDPDLHLTILGNEFNHSGDLFSSGLRIQAENQCRVNADIASNTLNTDGSLFFATSEFKILDNAQGRLEGLTGDPQTFINNNNSGIPLGIFLNDGSTGSFSAGNADTPTVTTLP